MIGRDEKGRFTKDCPTSFKQGYDPRRDKSPRATDFKKRDLYMNIFNWLKEHITEPELTVNEDKSNEHIVNIWFTILNHDPNMFDPKSTYAIQYANSFIRVCAEYIPEFQKEDDFYFKRWVDPVLQPEFCVWFMDKKAKLENFMSKEYFVRGKMKDNEILKRRFKRTWSESKVVDLTAEQNVKLDSDNKIELRIVDA